MSTGTTRDTRDDFCYRHPDRRSFVLCQRCLRTVCAECQTPMPVGVICPECAKAARQNQPAAARPRRIGRYASVPVATLTIIAVTVVVYLAQLIPNSPVIGWFAFNSGVLEPSGGLFQPWRALTMVLVHDGIWHIGLNMLTLYLVGRSLEPLLGHARFVALFTISALGGAAAVTLLAPESWVVGASGAIFGLFGAMLIIGRHLGANIRGIAILVGINFAFPFILAFFRALSTGSFSGALDAIAISWQAHLGGLIAGALIGWVFARTRTADKQIAQRVMLAGITLLCLLALAVPALT